MTHPSAGDHDSARAPRALADLPALLADPAGERGETPWNLREPGRQLDANLVRLPAGGRVPEHREADLDVLVLVIEGSGTLQGADAPVPLRAGALAWLPRGARRGIDAGPDGLAYLTVHTRRPGLRVRPAPPA